MKTWWLQPELLTPVSAEPPPSQAQKTYSLCMGSGLDDGLEDQGHWLCPLWGHSRGGWWSLGLWRSGGPAPKSRAHGKCHPDIWWPMLMASCKQPHGEAAPPSAEVPLQHNRDPEWGGPLVLATKDWVLPPTWGPSSAQPCSHFPVSCPLQHPRHMFPEAGVYPH